MIDALFAGLENPATPDIFAELAKPANLLRIATIKDIQTAK